MFLSFADKKHISLASSAASIYVYLSFDHEPYFQQEIKLSCGIVSNPYLQNTSVKSCWCLFRGFNLTVSH